jgi:hypothetical protein
VPRPKIHQDWVNRVHQLASDEVKPLEAFHTIELEAFQAGRDDAPSYTTVRKLYRLFAQLAPAEQLDYRLFRWPDSMLRGALPWEAASAGLELLRFCYEMKQGRPSVRMVKWFWRLRLAAPDLPPSYAWSSAGTLAGEEAARSAGYNASVPTEPLELLLAYTKWRSPEDDEKHREAAERLGVNEHHALDMSTMTPEQRTTLMLSVGAEYVGLECDEAAARDLMAMPQEDKTALQ